MARKIRNVRPLLTTATVAAGMAVLSTVVWASIQSASGQMTVIVAPPSVEFHQLESDTTQFVFNERQCVTLGAALQVNISVPGVYDDLDDLTPAKIPAGTRVSSHFVNADKVGKTDPRIELEGTLTTDAPILGVILRQNALDRSDFLGAIGTVYPTFQNGRAMALNGHNDQVVLAANLREITIRTDNQFHNDQIRVVTACRVGTGTEGCTPGYWKQTQHFDSWKTYVPTDKFNTVFGVNVSVHLTLLDALSLGGGGVNALARHAVAALLSAANSEVDYGMTVLEVIAATQAAINSGDPTLIEGTKNKFAALNEKGCPLN